MTSYGLDELTLAMFEPIQLPHVPKVTGSKSGYVGANFTQNLTHTARTWLGAVCSLGGGGKCKFR